MRLLSPEDVKDTKAKSAQETQHRIHQLAAEESRLVRAVNSLKGAFAVNTKRLQEETDIFVAEQTMRRDESRREVEKLESRRRDALKPINELREQAEDLMYQANSQLKKIALEEIAVKEKQEVITIKLEKIADLNDEISERIERLDKREQGIVKVEKRIKQSSDTLAADWLAYHAAINSSNVNHATKEKELQAKEQTLIIREEILKKQQQKIIDDTRLLQDQRATLQSAWDELHQKIDKKINPSL